ncbi:CopD family protein [Halomonas sp. C05BenzN]|uniref:CopD family protein n=1 Tax=Halomonas sp. C05BenzN TaxID=3411041 RepID=UPI003B92D7E0
MPWIKLVHIVALVSWCGALLYLPVMLAQSARGAPRFAPASPPMPRFVYNSLATPAALFAIVSGTLLFLVQGLAGGWLVLKLLAVTGMVLAHGTTGWLLLRLEQGEARGVAGGAMAAWGLAATCMLVVVGLVLVKPAL